MATDYIRYACKYMILVRSPSSDAQTTYIILHSIDARTQIQQPSTTIINILKRTYSCNPSPSFDARRSDNLHEYTTAFRRRSDIHHPSMLARSLYVMALLCASLVDEHTYHRRSTTDHGLSTTDGRSYHRQSTIHTLTYMRGYSR